MKKEEFLPKVEEELKRYELDNYYQLLNQAIDNITNLNYDDITVSPKAYVNELLKKNEISPVILKEKKRIKNAKMGIFASLLFIAVAAVMFYFMDYFADMLVVQIVCIIALFFMAFGTFINLMKHMSSVYTFAIITTLTVVSFIIGLENAFPIILLLILVFGCINLFESVRYRLGRKKIPPIDISSFSSSEILEIKMTFGVRNLNLTDETRYLKLKSSFGKVHVNATAITDELVIDLRGSFGQILIDIPDNAIVVDNTSLSFGSNKHSHINGDGPKIIIIGKVSFGEIKY